jgi:hypothetical protein
VCGIEDCTVIVGRSLKNEGVCWKILSQVIRVLSSEWVITVRTRLLFTECGFLAYISVAVVASVGSMDDKVRPKLAGRNLDGEREPELPE